MTIDLKTDEIMFERRGEQGELAWVTFNRPQARNALTFAMYEAVHDISVEANRDRSIKVIVFTGAGGKAFAAGTDISQFRAFETEQDALDYEGRMDRVLNALESVRVPTLAAIQGACTGGGAGIASACDMRIGSPSTRFGFPIARTLGNTLSMGNFVRLSLLVGPARLKDIIFTSRLVAAGEARAIGWLNEVTPDEASLPVRAEELARALAGQAPLTLETTKEALRRIREQMAPQDGGHDLVVQAYMSRDFKEGVEAFLGKRKPNWTGA